MMDQKGQRKEWAGIVAKAWADESFKARLLADPKAVLAEAGIELDEGMKCTVVEELDKQIVLVLPRKPAGNNVERDEVRRSAWIFHSSPPA